MDIPASLIVSSSKTSLVFNDIEVTDKSIEHVSTYTVTSTNNHITIHRKYSGGWCSYICIPLNLLSNGFELYPNNGLCIEYYNMLDRRIPTSLDCIKVTHTASLDYEKAWVLSGEVLEALSILIQSAVTAYSTTSKTII